MHVAQISFFTDPHGRAPERLLHDWPTLPDVAEAASGGGAQVTVVQACPHVQSLVRNGVNYHFLPFGRGAPRRHGTQSFAKLLSSLAPDVLHVQGLGFVHDVLSLAALAPGIPIVLQDHANRPPRLWRRRLWRRGLSVASGIAFSSLQQALPFTNAGLIHPQTKLYEIPESTSRFAPGDQAGARRATGLTGNPLLLWVGHLDSNKDPLTVLEGISKAVSAALPELQAYFCYGSAPLLRAVRRRIGADPFLNGRVHLLGRVPHERVEQLMRAADCFVLGSHREGSGYSLIEALACGLPPIVTDIPSFRSLTGEGAAGMLWPCGQAQDLCAALTSIGTRPTAQTRRAVRAHFDAQLSSVALGRKLNSMYQDLRRRMPTHSART